MLLLIGGDWRSLHAARALRASGAVVNTLGLEEGDEKLADIGAADVLVFAYPFSVRDARVPTLTGLTLCPEAVLLHAADHVKVLAGSGLELYLEKCEAAGKRFRRFAYDRRFLARNAELSAEAAVWEAMRAARCALCDSRALVLGYGRFGRALALRLKALGTEVIVAARRLETRLCIASDGMRALPIEETASVAPSADLVLNTVPARVLDENTLKALPAHSALLELASAPYGFDRKQAALLGLKCELLPALPARYAPISAGRAIAEMCIRVMNAEEGEPQ